MIENSPQELFLTYTAELSALLSPECRSCEIARTAIREIAAKAIRLRISPLHDVPDFQLVMELCDYDPKDGTRADNKRCYHPDVDSRGSLEDQVAALRRSFVSN